MSEKKKIIVGVTGASGAIYARQLLQKLSGLKDQVESCGVVFSGNAKQVWKHELGDESYDTIPYTIYQKDDFNAPFASGSARFGIMIVCPCSMGTLARIATGISNDLITRAADVVLKERRKLILVTRETPLSLVHIRNMQAITEAGGIICPATPSFYSMPRNVEDIAATVVDRVLELAGFQVNTYRWNQ